MSSTCTSESPRRGHSWGFTVVELLIGLVIAGCLAGALAPVWLSLQRAGETESDRGIWYLQSRVALARFERDLRISGAGGCHFPVAGSVLEATPSQLVILSKAAEQSVPVIVEWEMVKGTLMRRWGPCPEAMPSGFRHSIYSDSKTMIENLDAGSSFSFFADGVRVTPPLDTCELVSIDSVFLDLRGGSFTRPGGVNVSTVGRVGW